MAGSDYTLAAPTCACGNTITKFFKSGKPGKFCSACRDRQTGKHLGDRVRPCAYCGVEIAVLVAPGPPRKYCSDICKSRANGKEWVPAGEREFTCACCSATFKSDRAVKYCSKSCLWRAQTLRRHPNATLRTPFNRACTCIKCGKDYKNKRPRSTGEGGKYCSRECAFADKAVGSWKSTKPGPHCSIYIKECANCARMWTAKNCFTPVCSDDCRKAVVRAKDLARNIANCGAKEVCACKCCGEAFSPAYGDKRSVFCSDACAKRLSRRVRGSKHRARARAAGVPYEPVNRLKVFARDGWRCQICGKRTPEARMGSMSTNAPELDHRVPLSRGGGHLYANVQCACRQCNNRKGNRTSAGQLPMFDA